MEAMYWIQVLDIEGYSHRRRELRQTLPIAIGTTVECIVLRHEVGHSVLVCLPLITILIITALRICDCLLLREGKQHVCHSCQFIEETASDTGMA